MKKKKGTSTGNETRGFNIWKYSEERGGERDTYFSEKGEYQEKADSKSELRDDEAREEKEKGGKVIAVNRSGVVPEKEVKGSPILPFCPKEEEGEDLQGKQASRAGHLKDSNSTLA